MKNETGFLSVASAGGGAQNKLFYQKWLPQEKPRAALLIAHGLAEHSGRYADVAAFFVERGYAVYALDHIGHGQSDGIYGHVDSFSEYLSGVSELRALIGIEHPDASVVLTGHSMGGLISGLYLARQEQDFVAAILSGAASSTDDAPSGLLAVLLKIFSAIAPKLGMQKLDANGVSRDPKVVADYLADPLVYNGKLSARLIKELLAAIDRLGGEAAKITLPILILHGADDGMVPARGSKTLFDKVGSKDKELTIYPELFHEIFNEPERLKVLGQCADWLDQRLPK